MSRSKHPLRTIVVEGETFGWTARGDDGYIMLSVWREPRQHGGLRLRVSFDYASAYTVNEERTGWHGRQRRMITPGVVRRVIGAATAMQLKPGSGKAREVVLKSPQVGFPDEDDPFPPLAP